MVKAVIHGYGTVYEVQMSQQEIVAERNRLRGDAYKYLKENDCDDIIYYYDFRDKDDNITKCVFYYDMLGISRDYFDFTTRIMYKDPALGLIGAVHK